MNKRIEAKWIIRRKLRKRKENTRQKFKAEILRNQSGINKVIIKSLCFRWIENEFKIIKKRSSCKKQFIISFWSIVNWIIRVKKKWKFFFGDNEAEHWTHSSIEIAFSSWLDDVLSNGCILNEVKKLWWRILVFNLKGTVAFLPSQKTNTQVLIF